MDGWVGCILHDAHRFLGTANVANAVNATNIYFHYVHMNLVSYPVHMMQIIVLDFGKGISVTVVCFCQPAVN